MESDNRELWETTPNWCMFPMMGRGGGPGGRFKEDLDFLKMMRVVKNIKGRRRIEGKESHDKGVERDIEF